MEDRTLQYYDHNAEHIAQAYRQVDFRTVLNRVVRHFPPTAKVLEIGAGSGRDAAELAGRGFDITATDGSPRMVAEAARHFPQLADRLQVHRLPEALPFEAGSFEAVYCMAVLMHVAEEALPPVFSEVARVLMRGGIFAFSANTARPGPDGRGRRFTVLPLEGWCDLARNAGFTILESWEADDVTGRPGIRWGTVVARKET